MPLPVITLAPFYYGITAEDLRGAAHAVIDNPHLFRPKESPPDLKMTLLHYFFKEISASQKYNVLRTEPVALTIRQEIASLLDRHLSQIEPRAVYTLCEATKTEDGLAISETPFSLHSLLLHDFFSSTDNLPPTTRCFLYVVTIGPAAEQLVTAYSQKNQPLEAFVMNSIAGAATDLIAECLQKYLEEKYHAELKGNSLQRYSPGYQDWHLRDQAVIFKILNPEKNIGVALTEAFLMNPLKSTSGIMGVKLSTT